MSGIRKMTRRFSVVGEIFAGRDVERQRQIDAQAIAAMGRVGTDTLREIEEGLHLDRYTYPSHHSGYAVHERDKRPRSRSEELARYRRADRSLAKRLKSARGAPKS